MTEEEVVTLSEVVADLVLVQHCIMVLRPLTALFLASCFAF